MLFPKSNLPVEEAQSDTAGFIFEITQACNHDCLHCFNVWKNGSYYPLGQLSTAETIALLDAAIDQLKARLVTLSGGEPLLREDLVAIIEFLRSRRITVNLITNGSMLDQQTVESLIPNKISVFELPLLGARAQTHDRLSGKRGAFDRVTGAVAELKLHRQRVVCVFVATRLNLPELEEMLELALVLGADGVMLNRFNPGGRGSAHIDILQASPVELQRGFDTAEAFADRYDFPISCAIPIPACLFDKTRYRRLFFGSCAAGTTRSYFTIDPLGNLRPCNHSRTILGNLCTNSFAEMISSAGFREFCAARPSFCVQCALDRRCQGGCKAAAEVCCGSPWEMDPFLAAFAPLARPIAGSLSTRIQHGLVPQGQ